MNLDQNSGAFDYGQTYLNNKERQPIKSGDIFDLITDDPIKKPLPSFTLLELQWALTRVVGMAGAAFPYEPTSGDDPDDDVPGLELDEVGDASFASDVPKSPEFLRQVNRRLAEIPKHHTEGLEGDGVGMVVTT